MGRLAKVIKRAATRVCLYNNVLRNVEIVRCKKAKRHYECDFEYISTEVRRLAHILEKSLLHPKWEKGHGCSIADELARRLHQIRTLHRKKYREDECVRWGRNILVRYKRANKNHTAFGISMQEHTGIQAGMTNNDIESCLYNRRSVRCYEPYELTDTMLEKIIAPINWSSTSCNRQPAVVFASREDIYVKRILNHFKGATGFSGNISAALVFCADLRGYSFPNEVFMPHLDVALGIQNCALICHKYGLSMTLLSWAQHSPEDETNLRKMCNIPDYYEIICGAALGRPCRLVAPPGRKVIKDTLRLVE